MPTTWKTVRVFISSSFRDMHAERGVLETVVFPVLRTRSESVGIQLVKIDPCDAASEQDAEGDASLDKRFTMVEQCSPFFIGLVGERYGKIPATIPDELMNKHPWLATCRGLSILELEFHLISRNVSPSKQRSLFYLRDPQFLADVHSDRYGDFRTEDIRAAASLGALKYQLRNSGRPVMDGYPCRWDCLAERVVGLEAFAVRVTEDLWSAICIDHLPSGSSPFGAEKLLWNTAQGGVDFSYSVTGADLLNSTYCAGDATFDPGDRSRDRSPPTDLAASKPRQTPIIDENVQFTVYRPKIVRPNEWYAMLAFAHLDALPDHADPAEPDPVEEVHRQATMILGPQASGYNQTTKDSRVAVPREGEITFLPSVNGISFNPPSRTFLFVENVHREEFRLRASREMNGQTAKGTLAVYLGSILLAEVPLGIRVESEISLEQESGSIEKSTVSPYRKIFASYSHKDLTIVEEMERFARTLGDIYIRDWIHLRAGEIWNDRLLQMIEEADVFQLFWSTNSMHSAFVEREWRHALSLRRTSFVRPTYWEEPIPTSAEKNLPPPELGQLHFQRLSLGIPTPIQDSRLAAKTDEVFIVARDSPTTRSSKKIKEPAERSEFELKLDADGDSEFELTIADEACDEADIGILPKDAHSKGGKSGVRLRAPKDRGISLEKDSESEFELTLDDSSAEMATHGKTTKEKSDAEKDIFETDFDIPALDDESASEAVLLEEGDADLESSDFDLALDESGVVEESFSAVVELEEDVDADEAYSGGNVSAVGRTRSEALEILVAIGGCLLVVAAAFGILWFLFR